VGGKDSRLLKISVVTPSYNQADFLERTLRSVHTQEGNFELEHLVIDGGSTDGSVALLERWKDKLSYISEKDRGQSHALNKGIARATGEVICWINSDDTLRPHALATVAAYFTAHPTINWAYGRCGIIDEHDVDIRGLITRYKNLLGRRYSYRKLLLENYISQPSTFFRKAFYERVGGVDESLKLDMDYDLWLRFGQVEPAGIIDGPPLANFRFHAAAKTGGQIEPTLRVANELARKYARAIGKPWLGTINYWLYCRRTILIYQLLDAVRSAAKR
jgi:glycosyltransferase involved in cell wall biosynthesis